MKSVATSAPVAGEEATAKERPRTAGASRRVATAFLLAGATAVVVAGLYAYGPQSVAFVSTDNAYVKGDVTFVSPKVPGYVTAVLTENNATVRPGQTLIRIDPTDYASAVSDVHAAVSQAEASLQQISAQTELQQAQIRVADAGVTSARATSVRSDADFARSDALVGQGAVSRQLFETARAENVRSSSAVAQTVAQAEAARKQLRVLAAQRLSAQAQLEGARAKLVRAQADLGRTDVVSPREGRVAARNVRLGEFVNTGTRLLAITPTRGLWVEANLRETQLARIRQGDRVQLAVDAVPDVTFCGVVEGALGASGSEFAVIPPDNATGNFTKIVRRFTVRILLDQQQAGLDRLATGMSVTPRIEIGSHVDGRSHGGLISWFAGGSFRCGTRS
ncbi:HlyD family secretion protein [Sphingomonas sp. BK235]|uniref:HlyD family secretion protein n=1 Tax=Sphingomonas sp. BK235 TaxID=2512131 RepID=UPI0010483D42|nr:HlyD family secretion protein [Sphingomonas sp. BK235]TCP36052.1 membrane fusion protein (multidrug efflux system) [Sphingomonas sp. BK235]